ncbi:MAG: radical SAM protein [Verrucomicrobia bacterium]|nr:radical SAM protein [Verrucomicrobiota bacterium]
MSSTEDPGGESGAGGSRGAWILERRPDLSAQRRALPVDRPQGWIEEWEPDATGSPQRFLTVFLTNRECPWRCLMCDLWRHTTLDPVPSGAIPQQIRVARASVSGPYGLKLYNAGSFFDPGAIPVEDHPEIARILRDCRRVVVECHPRLVGPRVTAFARRLAPGALEVAMGLETANPEVLAKLNKGMTVADFVAAAGFLRDAGIGVRAFILVKPPYLDAAAALDWAVRSAQVAFESGADVVSLIPTRGGPGVLDDLARLGDFSEPTLDLFEAAVEGALSLRMGRVFADLWDLQRFGGGRTDFPARKSRLAAMNAGQRVLPRPTREAAAGHPAF